MTDALTVTKATTATGLTANLTPVTTAQTVMLTATIATQSVSTGPTGTVTFSTCGTPPCTATLVTTSANPNTGAFAFATASLPTIFTTSGTKTITATYAGDANFTGSGPSTAITVTVTNTGSFTLAASNATVTTTAGAAGSTTSTASTITVTASGGFNGAITLTCPSNTATNLPPGVTCSGTIPAGSTSGTLTVSLLNPSATLTAMAPPATQNLWAASTPITHRDRAGWWTFSAAAGIAALFLLFLPGRKRYRAAFALGLVCVLSFTLGCGSSGGGTSGPVATTTQLTVASSKLASNDPTGFRFTINVTSSAAANGQVQLFDGSAMLGPFVTASNGTATISTAGLAQGTHLITAHYLGDSKTQASQSGTLYVTVTTAGGTPAATVPVAGTSGSTTANTTFNLTIN